MDLKQIIYRAKHRGCREADILFSNFVEKFLSTLTGEEMEIYLEFAEESDLDIINWLIYPGSFPDKYKILYSRLISCTS